MMNRSDLLLLLGSLFVLMMSILALVSLFGLTGLLPAAFLLLLYGLILRKAVNVVTEFERLVIFRLGRCVASKGPGVVIVIPFLEKAISVDMRERFHEVAHESCITKDNAKIDVDFLFYWKIINPMWSQTRVQNLEASLTGLATGLLRAVIGLFELDEALAQREEINEELKDKLEEVSEHWGVTVTTVEIREIVPPKDIQDAMHQQLAAERVRRATITQAQGEREAAVSRAEGQAMALERLYRAAKGIDPKTLQLKYLEALTELGKSSSTKYVFPLEFTQLIRPFVQGLPTGSESHEPTNASHTISTDELVDLLRTLADAASRGKTSSGDSRDRSVPTTEPSP